MHYLLREYRTTYTGREQLIEIHLRSDCVYVGRKEFKLLTRFPQTSRKHAVFYKSDDGNIFVKDLDSRNGVYVNDARIGSSLKQLKAGDVIGLGVSTCQASEGFVGVLVNEDTDIEEITDEDISCKRSNSVITLDLESDSASVASPKRTKNTLPEEERGESSSQARNRITCDDTRHSDASESSGIGSISLPQTDVKKVEDKPVCRGEAKSPKPISLQKCFVRLVRCDDSSFHFPPGVKNPFKTGQIKPPLQPAKSTKQRDSSKAMKIILHRKRRKSRKLSTDSSNSDDEYKPQNITDDSPDDSDKNVRGGEQSQTHRASFSVKTKHRKKSKKLSSDSSDNSDECIRQSARSKVQCTSHSVKHKHRRKLSRKSNNNFSDDSAEHKLQNTRSDTSRNGDLLNNNEHSRKRDNILSSESLGDSDKNADLVNSKQERKRRRNSSSVSSDSSCRIMYARTSAMTCVSADVLTTDEKGHNSRKNSENCKRTSSKVEAKSTEMIYSKPDVFYKSDDEIYLDLKSSQDLVFPKKEPEKTEDSSKDSDTVKEVFGGENSFPPSPETEEHSNSEVESMETIREFIQQPRVCVERIKTSDFHQESSIPSASGERSYASVCSNDKDEIRNSVPLENNKQIRKSAGRTLLTEPKPLSYVGRKFRGRDENFIKKTRQTQPSRIESKSSKFEDYNPPPPGKKRISHLASKTSPLKSESSSLAPKGSSQPAQPSPVAEVVEKNRVGIESSEYSQRHQRDAENIVSRFLPATDPKRASVTVGNSVRLEGSNGVLRQLLQMNTRWLEEQILIREPPPDVSCGVVTLPASFDSHESYTAMFRPLILLEIWERLFIEWRNVEVDCRRNCQFYFVVLGHAERGGCVELTCESVLAGGGPGPRVGDITVLEIQEGPTRNHCTSLFGYVLGHNQTLLGSVDALKNSPWEQQFQDWKSSGDALKRWTFRACIKRKQEMPAINLHSLMKGYNLGCVRNLLDCADAFIEIRNSPLLDTLLRPKPHAPPKRLPSVSQENPSYSSQQEDFIRTVSDIVVRGAAQPDVFLLGGAPGTGKTHVIMGLIERLLYRRSVRDVRVLVAAPTDAAIDEIGRRLIKLSLRYEKNSVRFVRMGHESQVDRQMVPYCSSKMLRGVSVDEAEVLQRSHLILSTLSGICAAHQLRPSLCIVDDASQCTEPETLQAVVSGTPLLVLVGDPQQRSWRIVSRMARHCGFDRSLFQRIMQSRPAHALCEQFRMHSQISRFPCPSSFPSPRRPPDRLSTLLPYLVLDLPDDEDSRPVAIVCEFVCKVDSMAAVAALISPSSRRGRFRAEATPLLRRHARRVEVRGPEAFLGREKDVVVLWAELPCPLRLRAALTRARRCLIICVGGQKVARANSFWAELLADASDRGLLCAVPSNPDSLEQVLKRRLLLQPR